MGHRQSLANEDLIPSETRGAITDGLSSIGYYANMISHDVHFISAGGKQYHADLVAYSSGLRKDTDTAVIAVKGTKDADHVTHDEEVSPFMALATPIVILADYRQARVRVAGLSQADSSQAEVIPLSRFQEYLKAQQQLFTPRRLERVKWYSEQLPLFDIYSGLMQKATQIAVTELVERFEKGVRRILTDNSEQHKKQIIQSAIRILGARILRDRLNESWPLDRGVGTFIASAREYLPEYFSIPSGIAKKMDLLLNESLCASLDFSQVSLDMIGKFYEKAFITKEARDQFGIHYTPSILAKTLLDRMPIEELAINERVLADPTCGSGSLLAAGYERLTEAAYSKLTDEERHEKLITRIFGNDKDEFATEVAQMTLMLFHPPHKNKWQMSKLDAESDQFINKWKLKIGRQPSIIVANPPFGGVSPSNQTDVSRTRNQRDRSAHILEKCIDILSPGGLLGIILTKTVLDQQLVKPTRHRILKECEILEQWILPIGWFEDVNRPALAWIMRKKLQSRNKFYIATLSDAPIENRASESAGTITVDSQNLPDNLVPSIFNNLLSKLEQSSHTVDNHFSIYNGLQPVPEAITNTKTPEGYPWSGRSVRNYYPEKDLSQGQYGWLILDDKNFPPRSQRRALRARLNQNEPFVMLRANRNDPIEKYKWSSIALIDTPDKKRNVVAPSENFHVAFSNNECEKLRNSFVYALWAILNHPLASLWFHERQAATKITTSSIERFPLPAQWGDQNQVIQLAELAKNLLLSIRSFNFGRSGDLENLLVKLDEKIFQMYGISLTDSKLIQEWFDQEDRPLLRRPRKKTVPKKAATIIHDSQIWRTTFETISINFETSQIQLIIDGIMEGDILCDVATWMNITPCMPGWILNEKAIGWIEMTTFQVDKLKADPQSYILSFKPFKYAYMEDDDLFNTFDTPNNKRAIL